MNKKTARQVGIIGWRGMVGSVLMQRMADCGDLGREDMRCSLFSTTRAGQPSPVGAIPGTVLDSAKLEELARMDCLLSCQGSDYTKEIHPQLRGMGWEGLWIDAASHLRTAPSSTLVLDVINRELILERLARGCRDFIGANCTVSLMLMAIWPLLRERLVEWVFVSSYQSASGAGARGIEQLIEQMAGAGGAPWQASADSLEHPVLQRGHAIERWLHDSHGSDAAFAAPLAANVIPWIDSALPESGQSREEWKAEVEANAILGNNDAERLPIEGVCVRVPVLRCHSQSLLMRMRKELSVTEAQRLLAADPWIDFVVNEPAATAAALHPLSASAGLAIKVGRLRQTFPAMEGAGYLQLFTVGDQLLWGAAEPLRRMLLLWLDHS